MKKKTYKKPEVLAQSNQVRLCRGGGNVDKMLNAMLIVFDNYVLSEKAGIFEFSGVVFEYKLECNANSLEKLIQQVGDFLVTIPKYMWTLKALPLPDLTVK